MLLCASHVLSAATSMYWARTKREGKGNDLHQKPAVKSIGWNLELNLNYLSIWQDEQSLVNIMCINFLIVPLNRSLSELGSYRSEDSTTVQATSTSLFQYHHIWTHWNLPVRTTDWRRSAYLLGEHAGWLTQAKKHVTSENQVRLLKLKILSQYSACYTSKLYSTINQVVEELALGKLPSTALLWLG